MDRPKSYFLQNDCLYWLKLVEWIVELIPENVILAEFWKKYYRQPDGWRMYSGVTANGYPELFIT